MKKRKLNRILILITIIALLLPAGTAYASDIDEGTAEPQTIGNYTVSFVAKSDVTADVILFAASIGIPSYITSKITLQSASLGSSVYTNVSGIQPSTYTVYNQASITHICSFPISSNKEYRIKIELTDKVNGKTVTVTRYKNLSR